MHLTLEIIVFWKFITRTNNAPSLSLLANLHVVKNLPGILFWYVTVVIKNHTDIISIHLVAFNAVWRHFYSVDFVKDFIVGIIVTNDELFAFNFSFCKTFLLANVFLVIELKCPFIYLLLTAFILAQIVVVTWASWLRYFILALQLSLGCIFNLFWFAFSWGLVISFSFTLLFVACWVRFTNCNWRFCFWFWS